ncbi:hypothetical protein [Pedobacter caeni]|nr:hypothetical protein [Pedobacter caeni]
MSVATKGFNRSLLLPVAMPSLAIALWYKKPIENPTFQAKKD